MKTLAEHYGLLLGLDAAWLVADVDLSLKEERVEIRLEASGQPVCCSGCGRTCPLHDHAPERTWRHLDTMQFETRIVARVPRTKCSDCGVKTCAVSWAEPHGRFTLLFEAFAIEMLQAASSVEAARRLLGLSWSSVQTILDRAVERGLIDRDVDEVRHVGLDEKSFGRGQNYVTVMTDIDGSRVLDVAAGRDESAADALWEGLGETQAQAVEAVAIDMWNPFEASTARHAPQAEIVHDRFHISKYLNEAVNQVRRQEHKILKQAGDERLTGTRQLWLYNPENISDEQWDQFAALKDQQLKTARAWAIREQFRWFWEYRQAGSARKFFALWYRWASRCRLPPVKKVAAMLQRRLPNLLTYFRHRITNAAAEGFNSRIQALKSAARGFRNFQNYRIRILFFCGKLNLRPDIPGH